MTTTAALGVLKYIFNIDSRLDLRIPAGHVKLAFLMAKPLKVYEYDFFMVRHLTISSSDMLFAGGNLSFLILNSD